MIITSVAPTRIGLIGGGTDVNPFAYEYGGQVLSLAISLYHTVTLTSNDSQYISISALDKTCHFRLDKLQNLQKNKDFELINVIINHFMDKIPSGFDLTVKFSGLSTSGLGTSASVAVAIIGAFNKWLNLKMSRLDIAILAWDLENNKLGWLTGKQDQLAAAFGGVNLFSFGPGNKVGIEELSLSESQLNELQNWTLLCFLGSTRNSGSIQKKLVKHMRDFDKQKNLFALKDSVSEVLDYLNNNDFVNLGIVLDEVWIEKKLSNPNASNDYIDKIYSLARVNGSLGGKVMGAGGGGHMFFFAPPSKHAQLKSILEKEGVKFIDFNFDFEGVKVVENV